MASKSPAPSSAAPKSSLPMCKTNTTFLSLPSELRQKILYLSYDVHLRPQCGLFLFARSEEIRRATAEEKTRSRLWALVLQESLEELKADLEYVLSLWDNKIEEMRDQYLKDKQWALAFAPGFYETKNKI
ncbi:hypothetical protein E6O75_ATG05722 [Venturia nashicola]|uniref:Uncharacterized protein n=1 Tax=Venturia nashicola TaxID=86259 RepID=A0A4Z1NYE4_9PEZI|nr:hypothetical protein E6O75_ATG05722 [Venturia nashicola]